MGLVAWGGSSRVLQTPCARADRDAAIGVVTPVRPAWGRDPVALELAARPRQARPPAVRCSAHACGSRRGRAACGHGNAYIRVFRSCCAVYMCSHSTRAACSEILCRRQLQGMRCTVTVMHCFCRPACCTVLGRRTWARRGWRTGSEKGDPPWHPGQCPLWPQLTLLRACLPRAHFCHAPP